MARAFGLHTHIQRNRLKTGLLCIVLLGIVHLVGLAMAALLTNAQLGFSDLLRFYAPAAIWVSLGVAAWVGVGVLLNRWLVHRELPIDFTDVDRSDDTYRLLENLCISRGMPTPRFEIMETDALNAFAMGMWEGDYSIGVTRGLVEILQPDEMEAVLAHELTHVQNEDVRLMMMASAVVGLFSTLGWILLNSAKGTAQVGLVRRKSDGSTALMLLVAYAAVMIGSGLAFLTTLAISRNREYMADAGAVDLTKNPDALVRALEIISGNPDIEGMPSDVKAMCIGRAPARFAAMSTHPKISDRIEALRLYAGAAVGRSEPRLD